MPLSRLKKGSPAAVEMPFSLPISSTSTVFEEALVVRVVSGPGRSDLNDQVHLHMLLPLASLDELTRFEAADGDE